MLSNFYHNLIWCSFLNPVLFHSVQNRLFDISNLCILVSNCLCTTQVSRLSNFYHHWCSYLNPILFVFQCKNGLFHISNLCSIVPNCLCRIHVSTSNFSSCLTPLSCFYPSVVVSVNSPRAVHELEQKLGNPWSS